ncbi:hypothetical protein PC117_g21987 [Phytophthora cactorum]|uniref:Integrase catalytic domain-containing protein n=3 Tax=Phytophthora cactorum TaxID=29920 RepID=A0A8T1BEK8_9STRA|nr:hypothetical protein PC117_g21987 [Phytophthora cactorum]
MDIASGYSNVLMDPGSVEKTDFTSKFGLYEWLVMPFGLCNAVPAFERLMENVLIDLKWRTCLVYLDDFPTHLIRVRQVLERFRAAGFKLKMKKCHWGRDQVAFLGHIVTPTGILPNPEKAKTVMNIERPYDLHTKGIAFRWNDDCEVALRQLQRALVKPPILVYPNFKKRFKLYADSSHLGVGACVMQEVDKRDRAVAYASKMLVGSQRNWVNKTSGTTEIDCWGIAWATRKVRCYLDHAEFDLISDHQSLTWIFGENTRTSNAKIARWAMELSQLQFKVNHRPGTSMGHADGLSRLYHRPGASVAGAFRMSDLLNADENDASIRDGTQTQDGTINRNATDVSVAVGEPNEEDLQGRTQVTDPSPIDAFGLDYDKFVAEQERVPWMRAVKAFLSDGALALDPQLRRVPVQLELFAFPLPFIETVLHYCHADIFSAHLGKTKTAHKVRRHAYWHGWKKDLVDYVRECSICSGGKGRRPWTAGLMQRMPVQDLSGPFSLLVADAIGLLVVTPRGNMYILVFVDYFTRWVEAFAVASLDTISFMDAVIEGVICRHGVPERLSDRGSNFKSNLARSLYETLGIKKLFGSAYHPQTQGLVERFNGALMGMLRMYVSETQTDWDVYLPRVQFAYWTAYHEGLGDTPFFSLYGRDPVLPIDLAFLNTGKDWKSNELIKAQDRHEKRLDKQVRVTYAEGDAVWVYQFFRARLGERKMKKLAFSWHGPYRIVGQVGENAYRVTIPSHPNKIVTVNVNCLKRFRGRWSRPFADKIPEGAEKNAYEDGTGPLQEKDLPSTSFVERLSVGIEDTALSGVSSPIVDIVAKRIESRELQYLVLTAMYETFWLSRAALTPNFGTLIRAFEDVNRKKRGLPELRRNARLVEANADVDDAEVLF